MDPRGVLSPQWRQLYQAAILETDASLLPPRIVAAESAIRDRVDALDSNPDNAYAERDALMNAIAVLRCLRRLVDEGRSIEDSVV